MFQSCLSVFIFLPRHHNLFSDKRWFKIHGSNSVPSSHECCNRSRLHVPPPSIVISLHFRQPNQHHQLSPVQEIVSSCTRCFMFCLGQRRCWLTLGWTLGLKCGSLCIFWVVMLLPILSVFRRVTQHLLPNKTWCQAEDSPGGIFGFTPWNPWETAFKACGACRRTSYIPCVCLVLARGHVTWSRVSFKRELVETIVIRLGIYPYISEEGHNITTLIYICM